MSKTMKQCTAQCLNGIPLIWKTQVWKSAVVQNPRRSNSRGKVDGGDAQETEVHRRKTKKTLSRSTHDPKGVKTSRATRGNRRDKKLTRVHDCKRGKATLLKPKIDCQAFDPHSAAEDINVDASQAVCDNVDQDVKPLCGC